MPAFSQEHAYGACHSLTVALMSYRPAGEARGLFVGGECIHSVFRVPHTDIFVDAFGAEAGPEAPNQKAARYVRPGDRHEWRILPEDDMRRMISGDKGRAIRRARPVASELLRAADEIEMMAHTQPRPALPTPVLPREIVR